jgi:hypothetical protein
MFADKRLSCFWYVLAASVLFMSILPNARWIDQIVGDSNMGRWVHFLAYATIIAIPFAACRKRKGVLLPLVVVMAGILLECVETLTTNSVARPQNVLANMFGVGAGILLGMNLRTMRTAARSENKLNVGNHHSTSI